jgi:hypothetical protein
MPMAIVYLLGSVVSGLVYLATWERYDRQAVKARAAWPSNLLENKELASRYPDLVMAGTGAIRRGLAKLGNIWTPGILLTSILLLSWEVPLWLLLAFAGCGRSMVGNDHAVQEC